MKCINEKVLSFKLERNIEEQCRQNKIPTIQFVHLFQPLVAAH